LPFLTRLPTMEVAAMLGMKQSTVEWHLTEAERNFAGRSARAWQSMNLVRTGLPWDGR
jgi:hypothetical protein